VDKLKSLRLGGVFGAQNPAQVIGGALGGLFAWVHPWALGRRLGWDAARCSGVASPADVDRLARAAAAEDSPPGSALLDALDSAESTASARGRR
jgi:hypothetical protein